MENKAGVGWDRGTRESLAQVFAFVPHKVTRSESLFPAPPGASRQTGCGAPRPAHRAPSVLHCGPQPLPGLWLRAEARTQAGLPESRFRRQALLPTQLRPGSSASSPRGSRQRPLPPSGRPLPRLQCPVPPGAPDAVPPVPPAALPSGAHLARPPPPARLLS